MDSDPSPPHQQPTAEAAPAGSPPPPRPGPPAPAPPRLPFAQSVFKVCLSFIKLFSFPHYQLPWRPHLSDYLNFIISIDLGAFHLFYCFSVNFQNE